MIYKRKLIKYANGGYDDTYMPLNGRYATPDDFYPEQATQPQVPTTTPSASTPMDMNKFNGYLQAGSYAGQLIEKAAPDSTFASTAGGALSGAATGASIGLLGGPAGAVAGAAIGGTVGLVSGLISGISKSKQKALARQQQIAAQEKQRVTMQQNHDSGVLSEYNTNGNFEKSYYANGGIVNTGFLRPQRNEAVFKGYKSMLNPHYYPKMDEGGELPLYTDDPVARAKALALARKQPTYNPSLLLPNHDYFMTSPGPGTTPQLKYWGNDLPVQGAPQVVPLNTPVILPSDKTAGYSNTYYPSRGQMRGKTPDVIPRSGFKYGGYMKYSDGGTIPLASDMHKFQGPDHEDGGIPIDTTGNGQANAEVEGDEVQKGNQIFSDRLNPSEELAEVLRKNKISSSGTYADVATRLGKMKGKYEAKLLTHSPLALRTGQSMLGRVESMLQTTFQDQEANKPQVPQYAFGGTLPIYADGGDLIDDPKDPRKVKAAQLQAQLAQFDSAYAKAQADLKAKNLSAQQKAAYQNRLATLQSYRKSIEKGISLYGNQYNKAANNFQNVTKNYDPSSPISNFLMNNETPKHANDVAQGYSQRVDDGMEMLKRLNPSKLDLSKDTYLQDAGIVPNEVEGRGGAEYRSWGDDYYPTKLNGTPKQIATTPPVGTTPTLPPSHIAPPVAHTPMTGSRAKSTYPYSGRNKVYARSEPINDYVAPSLATPGLSAPPINLPAQPIVQGQAQETPDSPSSMDTINGLISKYGADGLNVASYFANNAAINKMKAPTFNLTPAPSYSYTDRSGLAKYDNSLAIKAAQAGVTNTSSQGASAEKAAILAQGLNGVNQINQQENQRKDTYDANFENRLLQSNYTNTDIMNRQADVNTQVNNEKVGMGIQARNTLSAGEMANQNTRSQEELDNQKALTILAGTQDPDRALSLLTQFMGPERAKRLHSLYYRQ